ncbi:MAG: C10 family peptidase [Bacteroidales bacterium]
MKRILLVFLVLGINLGLLADPVSPEKALTIANNFYQQVANDKSLTGFKFSIVNTEKMTVIPALNGSKAEETVLFYIFNVNESDGFVIVTADDDVIPILGYSLSGSYNEGNQPPALKKLLENYKEQIQYVILNDLKADAEIEGKWNRLEKGELLNPNKEVKSVNPLLTTTWNQSPYYNALCPFDYNSSQWTLTGCVATAMAQIMKYWNYPTTGTGIHEYDDPVYGTQTANFAATNYNWSAMPNNVTSANDAVATLMYHCGGSVEMRYGVNVSLAYLIDNNGQSPFCAENALKTYFGYNPSMIQGLLRSDYSNTDWINLLKNDLNNGQPILYAGFSSQSGGHAFVCDGYDNNDFFHLNWGWGGVFQDDFWSLDALNPAGHDYSSGQQALIGIQPVSGGQTSNIDMNSSITISPNPIDFFSSFTVNADVYNAGNINFNGDFCAALFNEEGLFIDYVEILTTGSNPLPPGYHYTGGLTFSNAGLVTVPGNFIVGIYYRDTNGEWQLAGNTSFYNPVSTSITSPYNPLEQYSDIVATPTDFIQGQSATVSVNLYNTNTYTYFGQYQAALVDIYGNFVQTIGILNETNGLPAGYTYTEPLSFTTSAITAEPGTYILAILEKENGSEYWYFVGGSYFLTPVYINVGTAPLSPDSYEPNNTTASPYTLPLTFSGNTATKTTAGSNIHTSDDVDYYEINLDTGYDYDITARIHDSYNSGNGQNYTCDVLFAYYQNDIWSDYYDDVMPSNIEVLNGGTIMFFVAPYFAGEMGTYLLDMTITRTLLLPDPAGAINGLSQVCQSQSNVNYSVQTIPNATSYVWTLPSGATGSSSTNNIMVSYGANAVSGNISVMGHNTTGNGTSSSLYITVNQTPATPTISLSGYVLTSSSPTGNQWYNASGAISGATSQQYTVTTTGDYHVVVTANTCSSASSNTIHVVVTGVEELSESNKILVYPNPVSSELTVEVEKELEISNLEIINSLGVTIYKSTINEKVIIQTSEFSKGIYLIRFEAKDAVVFKRFVKH